MIGIDWGTSSFRAYRFDDSGRIANRLELPRGIMHVAGDFAGTLRSEIGAWLAQGETRILMCGMVGSRQGWIEAPYLGCPADAAALTGAIVPVPFDGATVRLVPGLSDADDTGTPEVMRGEETQIVGAMAAIGGSGLACLPGSHSKWANVEAGKITGFSTYLTGEAFSALRSGTILGRLMTDGEPDPEAFGRGLAHARKTGHLLHHLFGVRTLGLMGALRNDDSASYLSGLLIGHEVAAAMPPGATVILIGGAKLCADYARAVEFIGGSPLLGNTDAAADGLFKIGADIAWT